MADSVWAWGLSPSDFRRLGRVSWVVTEKIHGANFCLIADGDSVQCANRRYVLAEDESFFGYQTVRDLLHEPVRRAFANVQAKDSSARRVLVYGELFGGGYPHPDVAALPGMQPIQTGVWYAPDIRFCAFDLRVESTDGSARYLEYDVAMAIFADAGITFAAPLLVGSYEAALNYPLGFDSTIPRALNLPPLPAGTNPAEGVVVKPLREIALPDGTRRLILKRKLATFAEDRRFHEAEKWQDAQPVVAPKGDNFALLQWEIYNRVTENRLDATLSKIGPQPTGAAARGRLSGWARELFTLLVGEVLSEAGEAEGAAFAGLSLAQRDALAAYAGEQVRLLVKARFGHTAK